MFTISCLIGYFVIELNLIVHSSSQIVFPDFQSIQSTTTQRTNANSLLSTAEDNSDEGILRTLCPNLAENTLRLYRYDNATRTCYRGGDRGPCGNNMIFYSEESNRIFGQCDCAYTNFDRQLVYHPRTRKCYFVYSKAYCTPRKWLIFDQNDKPICATNACYRYQRLNSTIEYVPYRGTCSILESRVEGCNDREVLTFVQDQLLPICAVKRRGGVTGLTVAVPRVRCTPGSIRSITGRCNALVKFNLS